MQETKKFHQFLGFIFLLFIMWGLYAFCMKLFDYFLTINSDIAVAILATSASVFISVISVLLTKHFERKQDMLKDIRLRKVPVYQDLIQFLFRLVYGEKTSAGKPTDLEIQDFFAKNTQDIITWASDDVLNTYSNFRRMLITSATGDNNDFVILMIEYEKLLKTIRKDLGHENKGFQERTILRLFLNDV